jgi:DNA polymerase-3 subunit delta
VNPFPKLDLDNLPPTIFVHGKSVYFRSRFLAALRDQLRGAYDIDDLWCSDETKSRDVIIDIDRHVLPFCKVEKRAVFVWDFQKISDRDKKLSPLLDDFPEETLAVFIQTEGSRAGGSFIKALKAGVAYEAAQPEVTYKVDELTPWIHAYFRRHGLFVEEALCRGLHLAIGQDLFALESEMRRILTYCQGRSSATLDDFRKLVVPRVHAQPFDLSKVLVRRDLRAAMLVLHEMFTFAPDRAKMVLSTIGLLATEFRRWFRIICLRKKEKKDWKSIAAELGGSAYVYEKKVWPYLKQYGASNMMKLLDLEARVCEIEYLVKRGAVDGELALELIVLEACGMDLARVTSENRYPV